jgi:hypothetical protein
MSAVQPWRNHFLLDAEPYPPGPRSQAATALLSAVRTRQYRAREFGDIWEWHAWVWTAECHDRAARIIAGDY